MNPSSIERARKILKSCRLKSGESVPTEDWASISIAKFEKVVSKTLDQAVREDRETIYRRIEYCGFGSIEWRMKLIEKLKSPEVVIKPLAIRQDENI